MAKNGNKKEQENWTVTVYMAADNSLAEESVWAITEILEIESQLGESLKVEVLFDSNAEGMKTKVYSLPITNGEEPIRLPQITGVGRLLTLGEDYSTFIGSSASKNKTGQASSRSKSRGGNPENASDREVLKAFLKEVLKRHRNTNQCLILSGHGSGAIGDFLSGKNVQQPISIAGLSETLEVVINEVLGKKNKGKLKIIGMDSCLMSMAEVAYELRNHANILIGSEGFEPETGWPYKEIIPSIKGAVNPANLARKIVDKYIGYYADYAVAGTSVDLSACDLSKADALAVALGKLASTLIIEFKNNKNVIDAVLLAHWRAQSYKNEQYVDLWDFCDLLSKEFEGIDDTGIKNACKNVLKAIDGKDRDEEIGTNGKNNKNKKTEPFVIYSKYFGAAFQHSHGVSIYFPWKHSPALEKYQKLSLSKETRWGEFLKIYVEKTQRKPRGESGKEINIVPAERPLVIPLQDGAPVVAQTASNAGRNPPDSGKGALSLGGVMKNPPTSF